MPRRHDSLIPLSHQHQHALALAVIIRRRFGVENGEDAWLEEMLAKAQNAYRAELAGHFEVEESVLFPEMERNLGKLDLVAELLVVHQKLHVIIKGLETNPALSGLDELSALLEAHVHKEERRLFAEFEARMPADEALKIGREIDARLKKVCPGI
ncbi:MAG: hemerythrin domain-containing protein [Acidobacteria bacterium]|nr:hemerythrin domain-containing protein [Acidobacteriota bacterium]